MEHLKMNQSNPNKPKITAILGMKGAGKDTYFQIVSNNNKDSFAPAQVMFAGALKEVSQILFPDVDIEDRVIKETKRTFDTLEVDTTVRQWTLDFFKKMNYPIANHEPAVSARFFKTYGFTDAIGEQCPTINISPRDVSLYMGSVDWLRIHPDVTDLIGKYAIKTAKELAKTSAGVFFTDVRFPVEVAAINNDLALDSEAEVDVEYVLVVRYQTLDDGTHKIKLSDKLSYTDHITEHMNNELTQLAIQAYNEYVNPACVIQDKLLSMLGIEDVDAASFAASPHQSSTQFKVSVVFNKENEGEFTEIFSV